MHILDEPTQGNYFAVTFCVFMRPRQRTSPLFSSEERHWDVAHWAVMTKGSRKQWVWTVLLLYCNRGKETTFWSWLQRVRQHRVCYSNHWNETVLHGYESRGNWKVELLCWRRKAVICSTRSDELLLHCIVAWCIAKPVVKFRWAFFCAGILVALKWNIEEQWM
jgi:hypothetical protein